MVRKLKNPTLILFSFLAALFLASACGKNYNDQIPIGLECMNGMCGGFGFDDPTQIDDGSYYKGNDPDGGRTSGGGGTLVDGGTTSDGGGSTGGGMKAAPRRFSYVQKNVLMNGGPDI